MEIRMSIFILPICLQQLLQHYASSLINAVSTNYYKKKIIFPPPYTTWVKLMTHLIHSTPTSRSTLNHQIINEQLVKHQYTFFLFFSVVKTTVTNPFWQMDTQYRTIVSYMYTYVCIISPQSLRTIVIPLGVVLSSFRRYTHVKELHGNSFFYKHLLYNLYYVLRNTALLTHIADNHQHTNIGTYAYHKPFLYYHSLVTSRQQTSYSFIVFISFCYLVHDPY